MHDHLVDRYHDLAIHRRHSNTELKAVYQRYKIHFIGLQYGQFLIHSPIDAGEYLFIAAVCPNFDFSSLII